MWSWVDPMCSLSLFFKICEIRTTTCGTDQRWELCEITHAEGLAQCLAYIRSWVTARSSPHLHPEAGRWTFKILCFARQAALARLYPQNVKSKYKWGAGGTDCVTASTDQTGWIIAVAPPHTMDTATERVGKHTKLWGVTLGTCQQLWLGVSQDNKWRKRSSESCCLFSISRGQSLLCFSSLGWKTVPWNAPGFREQLERQLQGVLARSWSEASKQNSPCPPGSCGFGDAGRRKQGTSKVLFLPPPFPNIHVRSSLGRPWPSFLPPSQRVKGRERGRWVKGGLFPFSEVMERQQKTSKPSPKLDSAGGLCFLSKGKLCISSHCSSLLSSPSWKAHVCAGMYQAPNTVFNHNCIEWQSCNYSILLSEVLSRLGKRKLSVNYDPVYQSLPWAFSAICL